MIMLLVAGFMLTAAIVSMLNGFDSATYPLLASFVITAIMGAFPLIFVAKGELVSTKEGYMIVVLSWLLACFMGTMPYLIWGGEFSITHAWFESVSGFTATGSTILTDVEVLPKGLLFWRSSTVWLGGIGVVMFVLLALPSMGHTKLKLTSLELSSFAKDNYSFKARKIMQILLVVYVGLTAAATLMLKIAGMEWFDAVTHALSTVATGGFSTKNASLAHFDSVWIDSIVIFFMIVSGLHFGLIFATLTGKNNNLFKSEITRYYLWVIVIGVVLTVPWLLFKGVYSDLGSALHHGAFQVVAVVTSTGFATADTNLWPPLTTILFILLGMQCACAGSTSGGIKCDRVLLAFKGIRATMIQRQHPNAVVRIKLNGVIQENSVVSMAVIFIVAYLMFIALGTIIATMLGMDLMTSFSMAAASMGNVGIGFGDVGSMGNYHTIPTGGLYLSSGLMLLGRLEIFGLLQIFALSWWK